jgi:hypothetical protein
MGRAERIPIPNSKECFVEGFIRVNRGYGQPIEICVLSRPRRLDERPPLAA